MNSYIFYSLLGLSLYLQPLAAQKPFSAWVVNSEGEALIGATVHWQDSSSLGAVTDMEGWFQLDRLDSIYPHKLEIRHVSYAPVEVEILPHENELKLEVATNFILEEVVEVEERRRDAFASTINPINIEHLSRNEFNRAACCSLAESFENNATVNVSFSDAVTGAREIEMLGLRGIYTQIMVENRPTFNRLGRVYGLEYIPGSWVESIQISKGTATIRNGVQGITGQINTELIKPDKAAPFFINLYGSHFGRFEINSNLAHQFNASTTTGLLLHANYLGQDIDHNHDHFLDLPKKQQINALWRLIHRPEGLHLEVNVQGILDQRIGGQTKKVFEQHNRIAPSRLYQIKNNTKRIEAFGKIGYFGFENPNQSLAVIYGGNWHQMKAIFGQKNYQAQQLAFYTNVIFQTALDATLEHNLNTGIIYQYHNFKDQFVDIILNRIEQQSSIFAEYNYAHNFNLEKGTSIGLILGINGDWIQTNSYQKLVPSPRLSLKYNFNENFILRLSAGRSVRVSNLLIENFKYMATSRIFTIADTITPEIGWNYGLNLTQAFNIGGRSGSWSLDVYRTDFENQLIADIDSEVEQIIFYNLKGQSFSNSFLLSATQDIGIGLELRIAYKFNDVRTTFNDKLRWQPFSPRHRGLLALNYKTKDKGWQFDVNMQWVGPQRLPHLTQTNASLASYRINERSPHYTLVNTQISKFFRNGLELYFGAENLTNYRQEQPILGAADPFRENPVSRPLDTSAVYAPIMGIMGYVGLRYSFKPKENATIVDEHVHDNCDH